MSSPLTPMTQEALQEDLQQLTADEWFDALREIRPDLQRDEFDRMWAGFIDEKTNRQNRRSVN